MWKFIKAQKQVWKLCRDLSFQKNVNHAKEKALVIRFMQELFPSAVSIRRLQLSHGRRDPSVDLGFFLERDISAFLKKIKELFLNVLFVCVSFFLILFLRVPFSSVIVTSGRS